MKKQSICAECGKTFERDHWRVNDNKPNYCSRQCSCSVTGRKSGPSWNTGKTKDDNLKLAQIGKAISKTHKKAYANGEREVWNKGLKVGDDPRWDEAVRKQTEIRNTEGEWKDSWKESMRKGQVKAHANGSYKFEITKPEQMVWDYLVLSNMVVKKYIDKTDSDSEDTWYFQCPIDDVWVADFARPSKKEVIEVHGCYVHDHDPSKCKSSHVKYGRSSFAKRNKVRDARKYEYYERKGWRWSLVWECEAVQNDFHRIERLK